MAGGDQTFMVYNIAYVSVSTGFNLHWELELKLLSVDNMTSLKDVKKEVTKQTKGKEMAMVYGSIPDAHFATLLQRFYKQILIAYSHMRCYCNDCE